MVRQQTAAADAILGVVRLRGYAVDQLDARPNAARILPSAARTAEPLAQDGAAVLIVTDDVSEAVDVSDRILVMVRGRLVAERAAGDVTEEEIYADVARGARQ